MAKKLSLLMASLAVVAFAVPAFANAAAGVTEPAGILIAKGKLIEATNVGAVTIQTILVPITCSTVTITGEITVNSTTTVEGIGKGEGIATTCTAGGKATTVTDMTVTKLHSAGGGTGTIAVTFVADIAGVTCDFSSPNIPFTYTVGGSVIKITNGVLKGEPTVCDPGKLNGEFTLETDNTFTDAILD